MIYILLGIIGLLVIILVVMFIVLWQGKDYVYTREDLNKRIKNYDKAITSLQGKLKDKNQVFNTSYDFLNNLIDEERKINFLLNKRIDQSFSFSNKYNVGDNIWYVKDSKTYQGKIKNITTQLFKSKDGIKATQYNYLLECGTNAKESEIICVH